MNIHPYLNYGGNCEEAFRFYEQHLGGRIVAMMPHGSQLPPDAPAGWEKAILYARMEIGETLLMGNDVPPERYQPMRGAYLSLGVDSSAEAERIYALLAVGAEIFMPLQEQFFAYRFAMLRDRFGTSWMIIHERSMA